MIWITDEVQTKFHNLNDPIPPGWRKGHPTRIHTKPKKIWITDGITNKLHLPNEPIPEYWRIGRHQFGDNQSNVDTTK